LAKKATITTVNAKADATYVAELEAKVAIAFDRIDELHRTSCQNSRSLILHVWRRK